MESALHTIITYCMTCQSIPVPNKVMESSYTIMRSYHSAAKEFGIHHAEIPTNLRQ